MNTDAEDDEFYVSFSSRSCRELHSKYKANDFRVSWQTPRELAGRWKVALTQVQYNNIHSAGIIFKKHCPVTASFMSKLTISGSTIGFLVEQPPPGNVSLPVVRTVDNHLRITSEQCKKFSITFDSLAEARRCGFTQVTHKTTNGTLEAFNRPPASPAPVLVPAPLPPPPPINIKFELTFKPLIDEPQNYFDEELVNPTQPQEFCAKLLSLFTDLLTNVTYDDVNRRYTLTVARDVLSLKFVNGFNLALGFNRVEYFFGTTQLVNRSIVADYMPIMFNGIPSLKFFTNIIEPSLIDGHEMRILRSVETQPERHSLNQVVNQTFQWPMYMNVAVASINTIEIVVKTENYDLAPFIEGSTTGVTLHFKKSRYGYE